MEKDDDPWECLDVDDSDLQTLLRPSGNLLPAKRPFSPLGTTLSHPLSTTHLPSLEPCSQRICFSASQSNLHRSYQNRVPRAQNTGISRENSWQNAELERTSVLPESNDVLDRLRIPESARSARPRDGEAGPGNEDAVLGSKNSGEIEEFEEIRVVHQSDNLGNRLMVRPRIPGPAGAVQLAMQKEGEVGGDRSRCPDFCTSETMDCPEDEDFKKDPWLYTMDFIQKQNSELGETEGSHTISIKSIKSMNRNVERLPQLAGIIKASMPDALGRVFVTLKDPTGVIEASVHHKVLEEERFGKDFSVGSVIILRQVVVFSPRRSSCYLNITLNNVLKVISKDWKLARVDSSLRIFTPGNRVTASQDARMTEDAQSNQQAHRREVCGPDPETAHVEKMKHTTSMPGCHSEACREGQTCNNVALGDFSPPVNGGVDRSVEVKRLFSGTSLGDWTDEQINELFSNCEDMS